MSDYATMHKVAPFTLQEMDNRHPDFYSLVGPARTENSALSPRLAPSHFSHSVDSFQLAQKESTH